jgi:hypothetical protein
VRAPRRRRAHSRAPSRSRAQDRKRLAARFAIPEEIGWLWFCCCAPCFMAQELRHVRDSAIPTLNVAYAMQAAAAGAGK